MRVSTRWSGFEAAVNTVEDYLFANQEAFDISSVYSYYEKGEATTVILLTDEEEANVSTKIVMDRIKESMPLLAIGKPSFDFNQQGGGDGFSLQISGDSTTELNAISYDVVRILSTVDGLEDVRSDAQTGDREVQVIVDRLRAANVGLTSGAVADAVAVAMRGRNLREFRGETGEIEVRVTFRDSDKQTLEQLRELPLYTGSGERITLGSVADLRIGSSPHTIQRTDRQTAVIVSANLVDETTLDSVKPLAEELMNQMSLPPGYSWKFGRGFERQDETQAMMATNILLGIACIFLVMAALFESLLFPFAIILGFDTVFGLRRVLVLRRNRNDVLFHGVNRNHDSDRRGREQRHRSRRSHQQLAFKRFTAQPGGSSRAVETVFDPSS